MFTSAISRNIFRTATVAVGAAIATNTFTSRYAYCKSTNEQLDQILSVSYSIFILYFLYFLYSILILYNYIFHLIREFKLFKKI